MKPIIFLCALVLSAVSARCDVFVVGGRPIEVPSPEGYVRVTEAMTQVKRLTDQMADPLNDTLAFYIPKEIESVALAGELPTLDRYFILKVNKKLRNHTMSREEFATLKSSIKHQNKQIIEEVRGQLPGYLEKVEQNVGKEFDVNVALKISKMLPLDPHWEVDDAMAYSMFINVGMTLDGATTDSVLVTTATFVNPTGSLLFLYAYGDKDALEWTRSASSAWAEQVMGKNALAPAKAKRLAGFDWAKVGRNAIMGAVIGGGAALIGGWASRRKKAKASAERGMEEHNGRDAAQ